MIQNGVTRLAAAAVVAGAVLAGAPAARATSFGPRVGVSIDPDQVHAGLQFHAASLTPHLAFVPGFDFGAGDDVITVSGNMDFKYVFGPGPGRWRPYAGGGPGIFFAEADGDANDTDVGLNVFGGMQTPTRSGLFFGEMRLGLVQQPDVRFTVGWLFH
jgi:hypothetical protein